jgi:hypothetical protein
MRLVGASFWGQRSWDFGQRSWDFSSCEPDGGFQVALMMTPNAYFGLRVVGNACIGADEFFD